MNILDTFKQNLQGVWKETACCRHDSAKPIANCCRPSDTPPEDMPYCCRIEYFRTKEITHWMQRRDTNEITSNAVALLSTVQKNDNERVHRVTFAEITDCLIVFAILLDLDYGQYISVFVRRGIKDALLDNIPQSYIEALIDDLTRRNVQEAPRVVEEFQHRLFLYRPSPFESIESTAPRFHDSKHGRWIMPYCKRARINTKGGTAQVWEVAIQEFLVPQSLRSKIKLAEYDDPEYGKCYNLAVKTFTRPFYDIFDWEREAYLAVREQPGMVQYLGEYEIDEQMDDGVVERTYNIVLEFGEHDLLEFFADDYPPHMNEDIISFWDSLFKVAEALKKIHHLTVTREDGQEEEFHGWHADLKPDNILRVHGQFKLADFGFAKFKRKDPTKHLEIAPEEHMRGGTETYGAPECDRTRQRYGTTTGVTQTIDTWSFGCVLSVSATWVVLGYKGILAYEKLRQAAIKNLRAKKKQDSRINTPTASDCFHDGRTILPEVLQWHHYLRSVIRKSDTVTKDVLDFVETHMLGQIPVRRLDSQDLCDSFVQLVKLSRARYHHLVDSDKVKPVAPEIQAAFLALERPVPQEFEQNRSGIQGSRSNDKARDNGRPLAVPHIGSNYKSTRISKANRMRQVNHDPAAKDPFSKPMQSTSIYKDHQTPGPFLPTYGQHNIHESPQLEHSEVGAADRSRNPLVDGPHIDQTTHHGFVGNLGTGRPVLRSTPPRIAEDITEPQVSDGQSSREPISPRHQAPAPGDREQYESERAGYSVALASPSGPHVIGNPTMSSRSCGDILQSQDNYTTDPFYIGTDESSHDLKSPLPDVPPVPEIRTPRSMHFDIDPNWEICAELEAIRKVSRGWLSKFNRKHDDEHLKTFLVERNIKFVVDDGSTMGPYWGAMRMVLEVLASKIGKLDEDGLDLEYTIGKTHNVKEAKKEQLLSSFDKAREDAKLRRPGISSETDMNTTLTQIFNQYLRDPSRAMTLIVLTDGVWEGTIDKKELERTIVDFLDNPRISKRPGGRWFSIEFVSFGDSGLKTLKRLDDDLGNEYKIRDVIDTEPVSGDVYKMILGSLNRRYDEKTSVMSSPTSLQPQPQPPFPPPSRNLTPSPSPTPSRSNSSNRMSKFVSKFKSPG